MHLYPTVSPYVYSLNDPINKYDPDGRWVNFVIGSVVGAATDVATQMIIDGKSLSEVSMSSVLVSTGAGAVGAGLATKISKLGKLAKFGAEIVTDATVSIAGQYAETGSIDLGDFAIDVIVGRSIGKATSKAASKKLANSKTGQQLNKKAKKIKRMAKNKKNKRSKASQRRKKQKAEYSQNQYDEYVTGRAAAAGASSSQVGSKIVKELGKEKNE